MEARQFVQAGIGNRVLLDIKHRQILEFCEVLDPGILGVGVPQIEVCQLVEVAERANAVFAERLHSGKIEFVNCGN